MATLALWAAFFVYLVVVIRTAWVCDDAYITFRTVKNFVAGDGLRWNLAERVQAYTNPLWMFLVSACFFVTREAFLTVIALSVAVSAVAVWLVATRLASSHGSALLVLAGLVAS